MCMRNFLSLIYTILYIIHVLVLMEEAKGLPLAIYMPSIIGASLREPVEVCLIVEFGNLSQEEYMLVFTGGCIRIAVASFQ